MKFQTPLAHWVDGFFCARWLFWLYLVSQVILAGAPRPSAAPRNRADLLQGRVTGATAAHRQRLLGEFTAWLTNQAHQTQSLRDLARTNAILLSELVEEFGRVLYENGASRRNFAETLNALQQSFPFLRPTLNGPWQLVTTWENLHPTTVHPPMPLPLLRAMISVALSWNWTRLALVLCLGFYGLLRPAEMCYLRVKDCVLSLDSGHPNTMFLQLMHVKTRTRGARFQSVRIDEPCVIAFSKKCFKVMHHSERLWPFTPSLLRVRFDQVLVTACGQSKLVYPSSLRPGGATFLFQLWNEDLSRLQWRGRWLHMRTMLHYVQELGAINVLTSLPPAYRVRVHQLAELCLPALDEVVVAQDAYSLAFALFEQCSS